jgi:hypothetical protein
MGVASKIPVVEGEPAGSGVVEATIRSMAERLGAILLGNIFVKCFLRIFRRIVASSAQPRFCRVAPKSPLPAAGGPGS